MKVELLREPYGDDLLVVNAARVSFGKQKKTLDDDDTRLIQFLARGMTAKDFEMFINDMMHIGYFDRKQEMVEKLWDWRRNPTHWAPFAHPHATFRITAPIFVARQLAKHQIGMTWSEVSRRYVDDVPEFYTPEVWRKRAENVKQGSSDGAVDVSPMRFHGGVFHDGKIIPWEVPVDDAVFNQLCLDYYNHKLNHGVCPEQARMVLPQSTMTEWIWTGSLYAWANVYNQRTNNHAQRETADVVFQIGNHMKQYFPVSWKALTQW